MRTPMKLLASATFLFLAQATAGTCAAAPLTLKCKTAIGIADLVVDIDNRTMRWGILKYEIRHVTDRYITAIHEHSDNVGAEVWVLDRTTGEYQRADVGFTMHAAVGGGYTPLALTADTNRGTCTRPVL